MPRLVCSGLSLGYEGKTVVSGLSFTLESGDYLCIFGENGSGKTTLMKAMLGLHKPAAGRVSAEDGFSPRALGYLPQHTAAQKDFPASVREVVRSGCLPRRGARPFYGKAERALAEANMERLGVLPLARRCFRELSGGQRQRALLARALCAARQALFLDEPASGLDPGAADVMYALLSELNAAGLTIVMVSHDTDRCRQFCSRELVLGGAPS
jgi:zinc transport system ATP-binding protein